MQNPIKLSHIQSVDNRLIVVPEGTTAIIDSDDMAGPYDLKIHGSLIITKNARSLSFGDIENRGSLNFEGETALSAGRFTNHGDIVATGPLAINSSENVSFAGAGHIRADGNLTICSDKSVLVRDGDFSASELHFTAADDIKIDAGSIEGPVFLKATNAFCGSRRGTLDIREQCLSGDPIYYCHTGDVTINHGISSQYQVIILAHGDITVNGNVHSDERVEMAAGVNFSITVDEEQHGGSDCNPNDPATGWLDQHIIGPVGPGKINVTGSITCDEAIALQAQGDIDVSDNITGGSVDIIVASRTGDITLPGDIEATKGNLHIAGRGEIDIEGTLKAKYLLTIGNEEEDKTLSVKGNITSTNGGVDIVNNGKIELLDGDDDDAKISANNGPVGINSTGDLDVKGAIECKNNLSLANDKANKKITVKGSMTSTSGQINVFNPEGEVTLLNADDSGAEVKANKDVVVWSMSDFGKLTINGKITTEDGHVDINVEGPVDITGDISTDSDDPNFASVFIRTPLDRTSTSGGDTKIKTKKITAKGSNVVLRAGSTIQTKTIDVSKTGSSFAGAIDISACLAEGTSDEFTIGDEPPANGLGVEGQLKAQTDNGGNFDSNRFTGGVRVHTKGSGDIRVVSGSAISVTASSSRNGLIFLDADADAGGKVILGGGTYSVDGAGSNAPGAILLLGEQIIMDDDVILTSSYEGEVNKNHYITLAAEKVDLGSGDLTINANGKQGLVELLPKGAVTLTSNMDPDLNWTIDRPNGVDGTDGELSIEGSGEFKASSNGSGCSVLLSGSPVMLQVANDVTLSSTGPDEFHSVSILFSGGTSRDEGGVVFRTSGEVKVNVEGTEGGPGGAFLVDMSLINVDTTEQVTVNADGDDDHGGLIAWKATDGNITVADGKKLRFSANGGSSGAGGSVKFEATAFAPTITLRDTEVLADAGDGRGGTVNVLATDLGTINLEKFKATVNGGEEGAGGIVNVKGEALYPDQLTLEANAGTDGNGGTIKLESVGDLRPTATEAPGLTSVIANGGTATGSGGGVTIAGGEVWIENQFKVQCSALGNGTGGSIILHALTGSNIYLSYDGAELEANGAGDDFGRGGTIMLVVDAEEDGLVQGKLIARVDGKGTAQGGLFTATANKVRFVESELTGNAENTGSGGSYTFNADSLELVDSEVNVDGGDEGLGGNITVNPENDGGEIKLTSAELYARGGESGGFGGSISIVADEVETNISVEGESKLEAQARGGNNVGGDITLQTPASLSFQGLINAGGSGFREGGNIRLSAAGFNFEEGINLAANGGETGAGGLIELVGLDQTEIEFSDSCQLSVCGGITSGGGGTINVSTDGQIFFDNESELSASANEAGDGTGGVITIYSSSAAVNISGRILAEGNGQGNGGEISIISDNETVTLGSSTTISASSLGDEGDGGSITINVAENLQLDEIAALSLVDEPSPRLAARGAGVGVGGNITVSKIGQCDFLREVDVDAGADADEAVFAGKVTFNGQSVRAYRGPKTKIWPKRFWIGSSSQESPDSWDQAPAYAMSQPVFDNLRDNFLSAKVEAFIFDDPAQFGKFFARTMDDLNGGETFNQSSTGEKYSHIYCCVTKQGSNGDPVLHFYTENELWEVMAHELGHAVNFINKVVESNSYQADFLLDLADLDTAPACGEGSMFRMVKGYNGLWVCSLDGEGPAKTETYEGYASNGEIFIFLDGGFYNPLTNTWNLHEIHAQVFAWTCFKHGARPRFDKVLTNGAFTRMRAQADAELLL